MKSVLSFVLGVIFLIGMVIMMNLISGCQTKRIIVKECHDAQIENLYLCKRY